MGQSSERFVEVIEAAGPELSPIASSWERCEDFLVDPALVRARQVGAEELRRRIEESALLLELAAPHLHWLGEAMQTVRSHAFVVADGDGIALRVEANDPQFLSSLQLAPGSDLSEQALGSNGVGTAIATGRPLAVIGIEHYCLALKGVTCVGAPIHAPDGSVAGVLDLCTSAAEGDPSRLVLVAYAARCIERELATRLAPAVAPEQVDPVDLVLPELKASLSTLTVAGYLLRGAAEQGRMPLELAASFERRLGHLVQLASDVFAALRRSSAGRGAAPVPRLAAVRRVPGRRRSAPSWPRHGIS